MSTIHYGVIFASPDLDDEKFEALQDSSERFLCMRVNREISSAAADFFCDRGAVTQFDLLTSAVTGDVCVHIKTATLLHPFAEDFEALSENQIYLFTHEGALP